MTADAPRKPSADAPRRIHLIAHANPLAKDLPRLGFESVRAYTAAVRDALPQDYTLTFDGDLLAAEETPDFGGRLDDTRRIRDLQDALDDPDTLAIVAANGGAWFSRILPKLSFDVLQRRTAELHAVGFSEMTGLVNWVARYPAGRGWYWLCPNYIGWKVRDRDTVRAAFTEYWRVLPPLLIGETVAATHLPLTPPEMYIIADPAGLQTERPVRVIGGCLAVLAALLPGPLAHAVDPAGAWLLIEDINEAPYRIDRHLAAIQHAGWFERLAAVIIGDFHEAGEDQTETVRALLQHHLPAENPPAVVHAPTLGHTWPMTPIPINRPLTVARQDAALQLRL